MYVFPYRLRLRIICYWSLLFIAGGCEMEPEFFRPDYTPQVSVFGLLSNDSTYQFVIVERTRRLGEPETVVDENNNWTPVNTIITDAVVTITGGNDTVQFSFFQEENSNYKNWFSSYREAGIYLDLNHDFHPKPGTTYHLSVKTPDGHQVTASTYVPRQPAIYSPADFDHLKKNELNKVKIYWRTDPNAACYQLFMNAYITWRFDYGDHIVEHKFWENISREQYFYDSPGDLASIYFPFLHSSQQEVGDTVYVRLMAMDRNYYDYIRSSTELAEITGNSLNLVEGGIGVFGAVTFSETHWILE